MARNVRVMVGSGGAGAPRFRYSAYGVAVASDIPMDLPDYEGSGVAAVDCHSAPASDFADARQRAQSSDAWHRAAFLSDGSIYLGWDTVGEFMVSADGRSIACRRADDSTWESFQVYMLGQALSFALIRLGVEPLHATTVVVNGEAFAFLGASGYGKSSLAASFLHAGFRLLTDDLLVLEASRDRLIAQPGPARIKLFPAVARRFLGRSEPQVPMNAGTEKLIVRLNEHQRCATAVPLAGFYAVTAPREACRVRDVTIEPIAGREAFMRLLQATFNRRFVTQPRLARQFDVMTMLATRVPVCRLTYPRSLDRLAEVRDSVLAQIGDADYAVSVSTRRER